ncbi:WxL domain-containing protein [Lactiplantibacillus fabifermentans]|uniref:WxL domain-containing protein n=2 Tax=Lactiplantibacillus fabifermentans TaxID=483011 RepID=A0A0R2NVD3_9LACO|nr:WxL domain-containing protein [Lactiplantibacillus fabifermentans]ETY73463.1 hypothetical protein LFAB_12345 [Lactiplantibacillus fabifermentans T30PCM01]KRO27082.1 hypothetical protein DY78_GL000371 [Lactiplantibacillus fabifermentans DSM 21115]
MQKFVKQLMVVGAVVSVGVSTCTTLVSAATEQPSEAQVELTAGELQLISAPDFNFGKQKMNGQTITTDAESVKDVVKVINPGSVGGWRVAAHLEDGKLNNFKGMQLTVKPKNEKINYSPDDKGKVTADTNMPKIVRDSMTLSNEDQNIISASENSGLGTFTLTFDETDASLVIPGDVQPGVHDSKIVWSLLNTPA